MGSIATARGRIGYSESGGGDGVPIGFLHGVGSDKSVWRPQLQHFGETRRAVAFDYPGYGESEYVEGATSTRRPSSRRWTRSVSDRRISAGCRLAA